MSNYPKSIDTIVFDLGGVLIDWNPRYLYRKIFDSEEQVSWFLQNICTSEWNEQQDAGRSFEEATQELVGKFPDHELPIRAWYSRWQETIRGPIQETVDILENIKRKNTHRLYVLTNWSAETFPWALETFEFLKWFEGIVVSGQEKTRKPYADFFHILFQRYQVDPTSSVFIDDNKANVEGARMLGMHSIHFQHPEQLRSELKELGISV